MLKIFNNLKPFFEDCYRRVSVREYSKLMSISPPTASTLLNKYFKDNLLIKEKDRNYLFFHANNREKQFVDLSRIYWRIILKELLEYLEKELVSPTLILFGSLSKAEAKRDSDIDVAIFANNKNISLNEFEKKIGRKIQVFWFKSLKDVKNRELLNNIINGYVLSGRLLIKNA
ncbi:nucleotidyltransferase domain-containing protein [Candidatus Pacearchaeota archaeon]|nr:nucleotidyltransferase domain-containing protein [Candidatus Pacearchaeota archaeon]